MNTCIISGPGDSFGEVALIKRDAYRNATIIADEKCDLMLIGEDLYDRSLKVSLLVTIV